MKAAVFGSATLDVICKTIDEVPRYESIAFDDVVVSPGGCGSNVAIGLAAQGVPTLLIARIGKDDAGLLVEGYWRRAQIDLSSLRYDPEKTTAVSIGLVDSQAQPRFIHTPGANGNLTAADLDVEELIRSEAQWLHVGGFFVLPGIVDGSFPERLNRVRQAGLQISLDVVRSPSMRQPEVLWPCMPFLDIFLCNAEEAQIMTGLDDPVEAGRELLSYGARKVIVKLGAAGCLLVGEAESLHIPGVQVSVADTTGAGDAFAAGLLAALMDGAEMIPACQAANRAGAQNAACFGALGNWLPAIQAD